MQIVHGGVDAFNAMLYGEQSPTNRAFFQTQLERLPSLGIIGDIGQRFAAQARETFDRWNGSQAMQLVRAVTRQVTALFQPEQVRTLFEMADFQTASLTMQRWVMANPVVRRAYHDQLCNGYSDTYVDKDPGVVGEAHYDWRQVNSGVVKLDEEGDSWSVKHYMETLRPGDKPLEAHQKANILTTWNIAEMFFDAKGSDPTSPYNSDL